MSRARAIIRASKVALLRASQVWSLLYTAPFCNAILYGNAESKGYTRYEIWNNTDCDNPVSFVRKEMVFECLMTALTLCIVNMDLEICVCCNIVKLTLNFPAKFLGDKYYYGNYNLLEFEPSFYDLIYS